MSEHRGEPGRDDSHSDEPDHGDALPALRAETVPGLVRRARRLADMSQREFAHAAGVSPAAIGRIERGQLVPSLGVLVRMLAAADLRLVPADRHGRAVTPMEVWDDTRDGAQRRFPAHLDVILSPRPGEWWGDVYGLARPPETFFRDREMRDAMRRRSQWEVRVAQFRDAPEPPDPWLHPRLRGRRI